MAQNRTLSYPCHTEIQGQLIGAYNKLDVIYIPFGVRVFIGLDSVLDINNDNEIDNKLTYKKNGVFTTPKKLYLHTIGTSDEALNISCNVINNGQEYFENEKQETLVLDTISKQILEDTKLANENILKFLNPYEFTSDTSAEDSTTSLATLVNKTLTSDKIVITLSSYSVQNISNYHTGNHAIRVSLDGVAVCLKSIYAGVLLSRDKQITLENVKGKNLVIDSISSSGLIKNCYLLQEYTLKI